LKCFAARAISSLFLAARAIRSSSLSPPGQFVLHRRLGKHFELPWRRSIIGWLVALAAMEVWLPLALVMRSFHSFIHGNFVLWITCYH
jgi:type VI protein secretion system component VasF